jgi:hypothetical protein
VGGRKPVGLPAQRIVALGALPCTPGEALFVVVCDGTSFGSEISPATFVPIDAQGKGEFGTGSRNLAPRPACHLHSHVLLGPQAKDVGPTSPLPTSSSPACSRSTAQQRGVIPSLPRNPSATGRAGVRCHRYRVRASFPGSEASPDSSTELEMTREREAIRLLVSCKDRESEMLHLRTPGLTMSHADRCGGDEKARAAATIGLEHMPSYWTHPERPSRRFS